MPDPVWTTKEQYLLETWMDCQFGVLKDKQYAQVAQRAIADVTFRADLLSSTMNTLANEGITPSVTVYAYENTDTTVHMVLPPTLAQSTLSDAFLHSRVGKRKATDDYNTGDPILPCIGWDNDNDEGDPSPFD